MTRRLEDDLKRSASSGLRLRLPGSNRDILENIVDDVEWWCESLSFWVFGVCG